jgi:uncharacterized protein YdiU (UPF0061 family)
LARFAETLLPLLAEDRDKAVALAQEAIGAFVPAFETAYQEGFCRKLGLLRIEPGDLALGQDLLALMASQGADFTLTFRRLCDAALGPEGENALRGLFADAGGIDEWLLRWRHRFASDGGGPVERRAAMRRANPLFIPRNHMVEEAIAAAQNARDFEPFERLLTVLSAPYEDQPGFERYADPPRPDQIVHETFCGT